jgi:hypothetical protein
MCWVHADNAHTSQTPSQKPNMCWVHADNAHILHKHRVKSRICVGYMQTMPILHKHRVKSSMSNRDLQLPLGRFTPLPPPPLYAIDMYTKDNV